MTLVGPSIVSALALLGNDSEVRCPTQGTGHKGFKRVSQGPWESRLPKSGLKKLAQRTAAPCTKALHVSSEIGARHAVLRGHGWRALPEASSIQNCVIGHVLLGAATGLAGLVIFTL